MLEREHKNTSQEFNRDSSLPCGWVSMHSGGYRVTMKSGKLWLQELTGADGIVHRTLPFDELRPVQMDEFALSGAPIVFRFMRKTLRANISETSLVPLINEQGEEEKGRDEREFSWCSFLWGFGCRGTERRRA